MSRPLDPRDAARADELLADRATVGLSDAERAELAGLGLEGDDSLDLAAAAVDLATLRLEPLPDVLAARLLAAAPSTGSGVARGRTHVPVARPRSRAWIAVAAGLAAAACAILWAVTRPPEVRIVKVPEVRVEPPAAELRARLLAQAPDAVPMPWTPTADPAGKGVTGDVVWSPSAQRGFLRFSGLAPNGRAHQYQLWIFDKTRDDKYPVDGGLFDVTSGGEVVIPITARIPVREAALFAITIEPPGGVVVSKREHIVVTAAPKSS